VWQPHPSSPAQGANRTTCAPCRRRTATTAWLQRTVSAVHSSAPRTRGTRRVRCWGCDGALSSSPPNDRPESIRHRLTDNKQQLTQRAQPRWGKPIQASHASNSHRDDYERATAMATRCLRSDELLGDPGVTRRELPNACKVTEFQASGPGCEPEKKPRGGFGTATCKLL
jgi:hypothetical protein